MYEITCLTRVYVDSTRFLLVQDKSTALHQASDNGHYEVVRVLLAAKATVNTQNKVCVSVQLVAPYLVTHSYQGFS